MALSPSLQPLAAYRRWVNWVAIPDPDRPGKTIKRPVDVRTGLYCKAVDPVHQYGYDEAAATGRPVGFVFNEADGFWFLDIDGALESDGAGGYRWNALANELCAQLTGAAVEISQSGTGLHAIGRGACPEHACKNILAGLELYTHDRFVALTDNGTQGSVAADLSAQITAIAERWFPPNPHGDIAGWTDTPVADWSGPDDDGELLRAALASGKKSAQAAFGTGHVTFEDLWNANADALGRKWPSANGPFGASEADAALASHLAYWTGKNCERIRSLMWGSALARAKWEERPDWLDTTILRAASVVTNVAKARPAIEPPSPTGAALVTPAGAQPGTPEPVMRLAGREFLGTTDQLSFFGGCVYVIAENKIWIPGTGDRLDKARFDVVYAGHVFPIDAQNETIVDSAFDAFTKSRVVEAPRVDRCCFRPEHPAGAIIAEQGRSFVNTYIPIDTPRIAGDASPFLNHLALMLPNDRDRSILLHYMASMKQNPGAKFQWWPVIQGVEGNGKTMLDTILSYAISSRYSHLVNPEAMAKTGNQFNKWIEGNLYVGVEEIYVNNRRDFLETFKATVTNRRIPQEGKGSDQTTGDNRLNGLLFTNHRDGVPVNTDGRRYAIFYTAQQNIGDLERDGMLAQNYFPNLYDWLFGRREWAHMGPDYGLAIMNDYLSTMVLQAELDPAHLCVRAPHTSSTALALKLSMGRAESEVLEAVDEGRPGFSGGWISSIFLDRLLDGIRAPVPRQKRRELLQRMGYDYHPGLDEGRVNNTVAPDNAKPRLYVKAGHLALNLTDAAAIAKAYTGAQNTATNDAAAARFGK